MLFNKTDNGIDELKELTGFLYAYNNFDNIRTDMLNLIMKVKIWERNPMK